MLHTESRLRRRVRLCLTATIITAGGAGQSAFAQSSPQPVSPQMAMPRLDIAAASLGAQLRQLGQDTNTSILFTPAAVANLRGPALRGRMSVSDAARRLIAGTSLRVEPGAGGALVIATADHAAAVPADDPPAEPRRAATRTITPSPADQASESIVVVGSANPQGQRKLTSGYAITSISAQAIQNAAPSSAADLLKLVPGIFAETTSGVSGPNIEVRGFRTTGDAPFVTFQLDSLPIYPTPSLSFLDNSTQVRLDDSVSRVESTIGGPAVLFGNGQPGATVNLIEKNGQTDPGGLLRVTTGTGSLYQINGYYGARLADTWYGIPTYSSGI